MVSGSTLSPSARSLLACITTPRSFRASGMPIGFSLAVSVPRGDSDVHRGDSPGGFLDHRRLLAVAGDRLELHRHPGARCRVGSHRSRPRGLRDPSYAAVNGEDILPDLALGRLPAASLDEARVMVEKIVAYETREAGLETAPLVLVADDPDRAGNFVADAEELASSTLAGRDVRKIYLSELGLERTRGSILRAFDEGASVVSYVSHGGIHLWAGENLFDISRVESLSPQARQPIVLTMNCLNGYFHFPYFGSLSEELLKAEGKGAIAAFSPRA